MESYTVLHVEVSSSTLGSPQHLSGNNQSDVLIVLGKELDLLFAFHLFQLTESFSYVLLTDLLALHSFVTLDS